MAEMPAMRSRRGVFWQGALVAITNPKTIFFYAAFFPQFIDPQMAVGPQLVAMSIAMVAIATTLASRSEEHTSELQSLMRISYAVFCLNKKKKTNKYILNNEPDMTLPYALQV